jgi:hypothetical protein
MMTDAEDADEMTEVTGPLRGTSRVARTLLSMWQAARTSGADTLVRVQQ